MTLPDPEDWVAELAELTANEHCDDGLTTRELMQATGLGEKAIRARLDTARMQGRLIEGRKMARRLGGVMAPVVCYRIKRKDEA